MRLRQTRAFFAISTFFAHTQSLPLNAPQVAEPDVLAPRATYSVVPISGGSGPGGSGGSGSGSGPGSGSPVVTVIETVVKTLPPKTSIETVYKLSPPTTDTVFITTTISIANTKPQPTTVTSVVYVTPTPSPQTSQAQHNVITISLNCNKHGNYINQDYIHLIFGLFQLTNWVSGTSTVTTTSTSTTHDDGMWHTTYPAWNGTILAGRAQWFRPRQAA
ncbi:hypothetical protein B0T17DRAFT_615441 [Bombardia bombarda]|uniref:Uncharacterized protein n=1 Tax=Bombardia bombarda TaxID=252184 RepID=A0AA39XA60_9PEZI|nr:hypothetical protein B0T17DRAFT_615441 [Bombardia bombarda]